MVFSRGAVLDGRVDLDVEVAPVDTTSFPGFHVDDGRAAELQFQFPRA